MNQLIPTYSFIKLFTPRLKLCNTGVYNDKFRVYNMGINMNIVHKDYIINTHVNVQFDNNIIDETIQVIHSNNYFLINYELKNNDLPIEKIVIPKFKIDNNNYKLLLKHYKFLDKTCDNKNYYHIYMDIQKKIKKMKNFNF